MSPAVVLALLVAAFVQSVSSARTNREATEAAEATQERTFANIAFGDASTNIDGDFSRRSISTAVPDASTFRKALRDSFAEIGCDVDEPRLKSELLRLYAGISQFAQFEQVRFRHYTIVEWNVAKKLEQGFKMVWPAMYPGERPPGQLRKVAEKVVAIVDSFKTLTESSSPRAQQGASLFNAFTELAQFTLSKHGVGKQNLMTKINLATFMALSPVISEVDGLAEEPPFKKDPWFPIYENGNAIILELSDNIGKECNAFDQAVKLAD